MTAPTDSLRRPSDAQTTGILLLLGLNPFELQAVRQQAFGR